jgi:hypothetical protein
MWQFQYLLLFANTPIPMKKYDAGTTLDIAEVEFVGGQFYEQLQVKFVIQRERFGGAPP